MLRYVKYLALFLLPLLAPAQQITGSISGTVTDSSGGAIPGAAVKLVNAETGAGRTIESGAEGNFVFTAVPPGTYTVSAERDGFKRSRSSRSS